MSGSEYFIILRLFFCNTVVNFHQKLYFAVSYLITDMGYGM